jgi:asparagine synthetase B (glutamine-hydrolysing)
MCRNQSTPPPALKVMLDALSRHWNKVDSYADKDGLLAVGCAGLGTVQSPPQPYTLADSTVSVWLSGNIYSPAAVATEILPLLAESYRRQGITFVNDLQGEFFLVIFDHLQQRLVLVNDRYGRRPVYYRAVDGQLIFASSIKAVLASNVVAAHIDEEALADFLCFAFIPGERTLLKDVQLLPPAGTLTFDLASGELSIGRYWDLRKNLQPSSQSESTILDGLAETFSTAVKRRLSPSMTNWLSLSAGMDSRVIAAVLSNTELPVKAVTNGVEGSYEPRVTADIARIIGVEHVFFTFDEAQLTQAEAELTELITEAISLTDGMRGTASGAQTAFSARLRRERGLENVLTGHGGEIAKLDEAYNFAIGGPDDLTKLKTNPVDWTYGRLSRPNGPRFNTPALYKGGLAKVFAEAPRQHIRAIIHGLDSDIAPAQLVSFLFLNELYRKRAAYALAVQRAYVQVHVPFYDDEFLAKAIAAPLSVRSNYRVHRHIIEKHCPSLLNIVLSETRMRPFPSVAERVLRGIPYRIARRLGLFKRDVPEHFFAARMDGNFFRNILLDTQTLDRGYFNRDEIGRLIDDQAKGQRTANNLLHLLTIVELWHRDCIDTL